MRRILLPALFFGALPAAALAQQPDRQVFPADPMASVPRLGAIAGGRTSEFAPVIERYSADLGSLTRRYDAVDSPAQRKRMRDFYASWRKRLAEMNFDILSEEAKIDYVLLDNSLKYQLDLADRQDRQRAESAALLPFADRLLMLHDQRRDMMPVNPQAAAYLIASVVREVDSLRTLVDATGGRGGSGMGPAGAAGMGQGAGGAGGAANDSIARLRAAAPRVSRTVANRAAGTLDQVRNTIGSWYRFYNGYDPLFTWWVASPYEKLNESLTRYGQSIRQRLVGIPAAATLAAGGGRGGTGGGAGGGRGGAGGGAGGGGGSAGAADGNTGPIIGDPIGAEGLATDLRNAMIPYTPEELIAIAEKEYAFSLAEARKAARQMGFGDNWKAAMDKVKNTYVEPGKQPELIRNLATQAEEFFDKHKWITIPALAREDWRMEMMTPERQRVAPFFLGGSDILVAYPTNDMSDEEKLMSLRGNNPHFSHATVFHELNPGHHLQGFMNARYNTQRRMFATPFWNEGLSLYWEMFLWDRDFHVSPEDRMGALFWRMHRSARIIFSLNFHLGKMTPEQAIQFLVDTVNFERANAEGEVRRSFGGQYSPLYQSAYMLGGLQLRALHQQLVASGKVTDLEFHDTIYQGGPMPIAMVRARLTKAKLTRDGPAPWRFADELPPPRPFPVPQK